MHLDSHHNNLVNPSYLLETYGAVLYFHNQFHLKYSLSIPILYLNEVTFTLVKIGKSNHRLIITIITQKIVVFFYPYMFFNDYENPNSIDYVN